MTPNTPTVDITGAESAASYPAELEMVPVHHAIDATVRVPGSKSETNRALLVAALASGTSTLTGVLDSDDTQAMLAGLDMLGIPVVHRAETESVQIEGCAGQLPAGPVTVSARQSGTTARFLLPALCAGAGPYVLDAAEQMRARPMDDLVDALTHLGADLSGSTLPIEVVGGGVAGGSVEVPGDVSSQFLSGLLLSAPMFKEGLEATVVGELVSRPYVDLTIGVMRSFGATVGLVDGGQGFVVPPGAYTASEYSIEPDASAASYFFGAAAITGGRVVVPGLTTSTVQGDLRFVRILEQMGCSVSVTADGTEVVGPEALRGVDVDMADCSDTVPTLAVVAAFAKSATRIRGVGFIRRKESDRIGGVVAELRRCGIPAVEEDDGLVIYPGTLRGARICTYDDHRMAMAYALIGLRVRGIVIENPGCVAKTFPRYFDVLANLCRSA
jgi:3-phosphoshikimate 1-carboxyvinyltransferase